MQDNIQSDCFLSRRQWLGTTALFAASSTWTHADDAKLPHQACGVKIGEVTDSSARIWVRLTQQSTRNESGSKYVGKGNKPEEPISDEVVQQLHGACPGMAGKVRLIYSRKADFSEMQQIDWVRVTEENDYSHQFLVENLPADTEIFYRVETATNADSQHEPLTGRFQTAVSGDSTKDILFTVLSCQMYADLDHEDGFHIYPSMQKMDPRFVVFTGDNVYFDNERPRAVTAALARYHWQRMYSLPRHRALLSNIASYWEKDDHDTLKDDSWPGQQMGELTFEQGQQIFRQQVPMGETIYRTFRWGKQLQIWLTDGRDFRSPNRMKDGPEKTIWGKDQKAWLFETLKKSDATWKIIISPTPIVGPDREGKGDNHANRAFQHEGDEVRAWLQNNTAHNTIVICGDRHWQYHSIHPQTKLHEFSVGGASDRHAGGSPGLNKDYHQFHRVKGGFLSVIAKEKELVMQHHDVAGKVVYRYSFKTAK